MDEEAWQHIPPVSALLDDDEEEEENYIHISAFPPNHHEGLQPLLPHNHSSSSSSSSSLPLVELDDDDDDDEPSSIIRSVMSARLYGRCLCFGIRFWKIGSVVGAAALALVYIKNNIRLRRWWWWWWRLQKKKKKATAEDKVSRLILLVKEKDQRINQLLLQIAHINQLLLTRRTVPVVRLDIIN